MNIYLVYLLVFSAVLSVAWCLFSGVTAAGLAQGEKLDFKDNLRADGRQKKPLERFVSPGRLFRLQLTFMVFAAFLIPAAVLLAGNRNVWLLSAFGAASGFAGWLLPRQYFLWCVRRRQAAFEARIFDLVAGLSNALKAGMAVQQALSRVSARLTGPMREEMAILQRETRLGTSIGDALADLAERMPCEDMKLLASSVRLTVRTGGKLSDVLGEMAETIRKRRELVEKLKTLTAQGRVEAIVLSSMPFAAFGIFYFIQPNIMMSLFRTTAGWTAVGISIVLNVIGYLAIAKITKVEI